MISHLTTTRLDTLKAFFQAQDENDLLGCYIWTQAVSSALLPILGDLEVSLRNALHRGLSQYYGLSDSFEWMRKTRPNPANPRSQTHWHKLASGTADEVQKVVSKIEKRKGQGRATPDDLVAALSFGFWEILIQGLQHKSHPKDMQAKVLAVAFRNAPDLASTPYGDKAFVSRLSSLLYQVRDVRNRIGHHDQIWRTAEFDNHGKRGFIPRRPRHTLTSLRLFADHALWLASWIAPEVAAHIETSDHWWSLQALLTPDALAIYRLNAGKAGCCAASLHAAAPPRVDIQANAIQQSYL